MAPTAIETSGPKYVADMNVYAVRLTIAALAALLMAVVAHDVLVQGPLSATDAATLAWIMSARTIFLDHLMTWVSVSGGPSATSVYASILVAVFLVRRRFALASAVAAVVYGAAGTNVALKHLVQRVRPVFEDMPQSLSTYSFPSGHAAASTVFGGLICLLVWRSEIPRRQRAIVIGLVITWVTAVCISRAYLGLHYPTDIVAGVLEGVCWLMLAILGLDWFGVDLRWSSSPAQRV